MENARSWKLRLRPDLFLKEAAIFAAIQGLALIVAGRLEKPSAGLAAQGLGVLDFAFVVLIAVVVMFALFRSKRGKRSVRILWFLALFAGTQILFGTFMSGDVAALLAFALVITYWRAPTVPLHNLLILFSLPGIGASIGIQMMPIAAALVLMALAVYDIVAVYWTKHMVKMAQEFMSEGVIPGLIVGGKDTIWISEVAPGAEHSVLGTGDLVLPSVLATSALAYFGTVPGVVTAAFAVLGLLATHLIFFGQKERKPMAALPPIAAMSTLGFLISTFLFT